MEHRRIQNNERVKQLNESIKSVEEFHAWTKQLEGGLLVYRGMANANWEVSASAYRRIETSSEATPPPVFQNYIKQLLGSAGSRGFRERQGRTHSDLELLAELQHNGAATCLIDFTTNALIALWFACWGNSEQDGKVIAMATDNSKRFSIVEYKNLKEPIEKFLHQNILWKWVPSHLSNRIVAQQSVFVFGEGKIIEKDYKSITIDGSNKKNIIEELEERFGITEEYLFSDFAGFALSNAHDRPYSDYKAEDHFYLGLRFQQQGDHEKAMDHYGKAIELNPEDALAYNNRGNAKKKSGDYQGAIADYNKAIELNPQFAEAYNNQGVAKGDSGDYQGAIADLDKAIEINPQLTEAYLNRGIAKGTSDDYLGAISDFDKAIKLNPQYAEAYYNRGIAKGDSGDYQEAIADYNKAIELNPRYAGAYNNRGNAKAGSGDYPGAIDDYNKAIELNPQDAETYYNRGIAKKDSGDYLGAIADYNKAIVLNPQYARAYYNRGITKKDSGDYQGAIIDYNKAIELNPKFAAAYHNRGIIRQASGDETGAQEDFAKAKELANKTLK